MLFVFWASLRCLWCSQSSVTFDNIGRAPKHFLCSECRLLYFIIKFVFFQITLILPIPLLTPYNPKCHVHCGKQYHSYYHPQALKYIALLKHKCHQVAAYSPVWKEEFIRCLNIQSPSSLLKPRGCLYGFDNEPGHTVHACWSKIVEGLYCSTKALGFLRTRGIHQRDRQFLLMNHECIIKYKVLIANVTEGDVKVVAPKDCIVSSPFPIISCAWI